MRPEERSVIRVHLTVGGLTALRSVQVGSKPCSVKAVNKRTAVAPNVSVKESGVCDIGEGLTVVAREQERSCSSTMHFCNICIPHEVLEFGIEVLGTILPRDR